MTHKELKDVLLTEENVWITLKNLQRYKTQSDAKLSEKLQSAKFNADQITETENKKFVSQAEKNSYADKYTRGEMDAKLTEVVSGLAFKGTFETPADLPQEECKDGWLAIVINDPEAQGKNILYVYETAEIQTLKGEKAAAGKWVKLNDLMIPGLATEEANGLMSKEDKKKLNGMDQAINAAKEEVTQKVTELSTKHDQEKQALEQSINTAKQELTSAFGAADTTLEEKITTAYKAEVKKVDDKVNAMDTAYKAADSAIDTAYKAADAELDKKITAVDAKFVAASDEQINALFA